MSRLVEMRKAVVTAIVAVLGTVTTAITTQDWTPVLIAAITGLITVLGVYGATNEPTEAQVRRFARKTAQPHP